MSCYDSRNRGLTRSSNARLILLNTSLSSTWCENSLSACWCSDRVQCMTESKKHHTPNSAHLRGVYKICAAWINCRVRLACWGRGFERIRRGFERNRREPLGRCIQPLMPRPSVHHSWICQGVLPWWWVAAWVGVGHQTLHLLLHSHLDVAP